LSTTVTSLTAKNNRFTAHTERTTFQAQNVVLATGAYPRPKIPELARELPDHIRQLHSNAYRRPSDLPEGGVLVIGSGQSGAQIAEELQEAGRDVHLAVSMCGSVPRRYRGRDVIWWLLQTFLHGAEVGVKFPTVDDLPSPAARFAANPHVSGKDGGHDIDLRMLARSGMRLYGRLEAVRDGIAHFSADLAERLRFADEQFEQEIQPMFDAYIAGAGIDAPSDDRPARDTFVPQTETELDLNRAGIRSALWATGYQLDFSWVHLPVLDAWQYPRHERGITAFPGLYAVGLPWLYSEPSSVIAGVGADAAHIVEHIAARNARRCDT
jgi:putative flavoprotein involved in K+ transport